MSIIYGFLSFLETRSSTLKPPFLNPTLEINFCICSLHSSTVSFECSVGNVVEYGTRLFIVLSK